MEKSIYKSGTLFAILLLLISSTLRADELTKKFHKEYSAGSKSLEISNKYGNVVIENWDKDQIIIDVKVTVDMNNREKAQRYLDQIDIEFSENDNTVSARTVIDDKFNFSGWGENKKFRIDYNVKMPVNTDLALSNKYGNSEIDELHGKVDIDIKYGDLNAGKLSRGNVKPLSSVSIAYGKGSIDEAGWLNISERYVSNMQITKCQAAILDSKYSKISFGEISSIVGECRYDNLKIEHIKNLVLDNGYTEVNIQELTKKLTFSGDYGSFSIERIPAGFESIETETHYMGVKLGIDESANYHLDAKVSYGGIKYNEDNFKNQKRIIENTSQEISGTVGKEENPSSTVRVKASYGTVKLD